MTWTEMIQIEPRLGELYRDAGTAYRPGMSPEEVWCRSLWRRLANLVGFYADRRELRSREAYDLAASAILRRLVAGWPAARP